MAICWGGAGYQVGFSRRPYGTARSFGMLTPDFIRGYFPALPPGGGAVPGLRLGAILLGFPGVETPGSFRFGAWARRGG